MSNRFPPPPPKLCGYPNLRECINDLSDRILRKRTRDESLMDDLKKELDAYGQKYKMSRDGKVLKLHGFKRRYKFMHETWFYNDSFLGLSDWNCGVFTIYDNLAEILTKQS